MPLLLALTKYSRDFESEADEFAFDLLKKARYSPAAFASILERLNDKYQFDSFGASFVSSHPVTSERIARARKAAEALNGTPPK